MPWFPELEFARAGARASERDGARVPFYDGIRTLEPDVLAGCFAGEPVVDDPRHGRVEGREAFAAYVGALRAWLNAGTAGAVESVRLTATASRSVEEVSIKLAGAHPELPVAVVTDLAADGRLRAIRVYHSLWPLTGRHEVRAPLLEPDPRIGLEGAPADYQRGLAAGDAGATVAAFEPDGEVREPAGGPFRYTGQAHHHIYDLLFANDGGIPLKFCTVTDDGVACALEYICDQWGKDAIAPQSGVAVYERGSTGRLSGARIYDDVAPPQSSDSSVHEPG